MIKNYFKIAWRNILRNKVNGIINIAGLAIGMACVILITFYVQDELGYDRFFNQSDRIYQVNMIDTQGGNDSITGNTAPAVGPAMKTEFPEVETYVRIYRPRDVVVRYAENEKVESYFTEKRLMAVDSNFLQVFTFETLEGDPGTCLMQPNSLVITKTTAKKYFGNNSAIGKTLLFGNQRTPSVVTAVLNDLPSRSSFQFDMLVPISTIPDVKRRSWNWWWLQVSTYVKIRDNAASDKASIASLEAKFPDLVKRHAFTRNPMTYEDFVKKGGRMYYRLQPLTSIHLYSSPMRTESRLTTLGHIKYVRIFSIVALFIIILACVNFMNLSTAQSALRAKEVGIRKVLGSERRQLIKQFLIEAFVYSLIAAAVALMLVIVLLEPFNAIAGKSLKYSLLFTGGGWMYLLGLVLVTALLAGSYPAFYLTSFKPVIVLKGMKLFRSGLGTLFIRNGLVVFQFTISTALIICTLIVYKQLKFTQSKDLGMNKENVIIITSSGRLGNSEEAFRQELAVLPGISAAAISSSIPSRVNFADVYNPEPTAKEQIIDEIELPSFVVDYDFIPTLQIQLLQGRNFSTGFSDSASVILNETALKKIGWKDPIGKWLDYPGNSQRFKVIGVAKDFNIESLYIPVTPFALFHKSANTYDLGISYVSARLQPGNLTDKMSQIEKKWKKFAPDAPFDYSFLDSDLDALYQSEKRMGTVFGIFSIFSIFVGCLGLFGLAAYTAEKRTREIGVRKVLGATVHGLVAMLSKDFLKLVLLSALISFPIAWWAMNKWLQDFAYRVPIGWGVFIISGMAALLIALITVSFQAIKAAIANPVKSLRTE